MNKKTTFFQNKKTIVSFVLSIFVFFIHFQAFSVFDNNSLLNDVFQKLSAFTNVAVPLFFIMSAALFYRDYNLKLTFKKWKSRVFSLCIPYLLWNTFWFALALLGNYTPLSAVLGGVKATLTLPNVLKGIFLYGYFEPFWFVFQLIVMTALCPIIYLLLKNKWCGLVVILSFFVGLCLGLEIKSVLLPSTEMVLFYLIGAWIGIHGYQTFTARRSKKFALIGLVVYVLCSAFRLKINGFLSGCAVCQIPLLITLVSSFALWTAFDGFQMQKCPRYMTYSFLIYALHSFVGAAVSKILCWCLPGNTAGAVLTALIAFPLTIVIICVIGWGLDRYAPRLKRILTGR